MASSETILLRNDLPGRTTHVACWSCPINDCSSLFVQHHFPVHSLTSCSRRFNFSAGRCSDFDTVSISIPRKVILVAGPSVLWAAIGTPSSPQQSSADEVTRQPSHLARLILGNRRGSAMFQSPPVPNPL